MRTVTDPGPRPWSAVRLTATFRRRLVGVAALAYVSGILVRLTTRGFDPWVGYELLVGYGSHGLVRHGLVGVGADHMRWALWLVVVTGLLLVAGRALPSLGRDRLVAIVAVLLVLGPPGYLAPFPYWTAS